MKIALFILLILALAGCLTFQVPSLVGTYSSSGSGTLFLLRVKSDHSYVLSAHGYGAPIPPPVEGRWVSMSGSVTFQPVPSLVGGPLKVAGVGSSLSLQNEHIRFVQISSEEPNQALEPTTLAVTPCAPSSTSRASQGRGSSLTFGNSERAFLWTSE